MNPGSPLWRQIHPSFLVGGQPGSQAFRPTPKDQDLLSFDDGSRITAEASWQRHTGARGLASIGVWAATPQASARPSASACVTALWPGAGSLAQWRRARD